MFVRSVVEIAPKKNELGLDPVLLRVTKNTPGSEMVYVAPFAPPGSNRSNANTSVLAGSWI
jgi:hypothetical protein